MVVSHDGDDEDDDDAPSEDGDITAPRRSCNSM